MTPADAKRLKLAQTLDEVHALADRILSRARKSAALRKDRSVRAPGKDRDARRAEHRASTGELRAFVAERSAGRCEACRGEYGSVFEMHHVEQGGARRAHQRPGSVLALCMPCHRWAHRGNADTLKMIASSSVLDAEARRAAEYRLSKVTT